METQYYNLIPPLAKSEDLGPVSPGSDDSGVQEEQPSKPQRPPRAIDTPSKLPMHSYINLGISTPPKLDFSVPNTPPPTLPKRMPYLVQSPTLNHKSHLPLQRSASSHSTVSSSRGKRQSQSIAKGICKCKVVSSTRQVNSECTTEAGKLNKNCCCSLLMALLAIISSSSKGMIMGLKDRDVHQTVLKIPVELLEDSMKMFTHETSDDTLRFSKLSEFFEILFSYFTLPNIRIRTFF